jgi:hypothetical protein
MRRIVEINYTLSILKSGERQIQVVRNIRKNMKVTSMFVCVKKYNGEVCLCTPTLNFNAPRKVSTCLIREPCERSFSHAMSTVAHLQHVFTFPN